ncbi:hypothetical protein [Lacrimispora saccharolytica]|nr:hypothetical protein [Lacrimispora saccharolytica]
MWAYFSASNSGKTRKDSRDDAADEPRKVIRSKTKKEFKGLADRLEEYLEGETGVKRIREARE